MMKENLISCARRWWFCCPSIFLLFPFSWVKLERDQVHINCIFSCFTLVMCCYAGAELKKKISREKKLWSLLHSYVTCTKAWRYFYAVKVVCILRIDDARTYFFRSWEHGWMNEWHALTHAIFFSGVLKNSVRLFHNIKKSKTAACCVFLEETSDDAAYTAI